MLSRDDILRMAREAGFETKRDMVFVDACEITPTLARFAALVAAAQREKVATWMRSLGYATGHGDTIEALLDHLGTQIAEGLEAEVLMEREACAKVCEGRLQEGLNFEGCAAAIRARGNK